VCLLDALLTHVRVTLREVGVMLDHVELFFVLVRIVGLLQRVARRSEVARRRLVGERVLLELADVRARLLERLHLFGQPATSDDHGNGGRERARLDCVVHGVVPSTFSRTLGATALFIALQLVL